MRIRRRCIDIEEWDNTQHHNQRSRYRIFSQIVQRCLTQYLSRLRALADQPEIVPDPEEEQQPEYQHIDIVDPVLPDKISHDLSLPLIRPRRQFSRARTARIPEFPQIA